MIHAAESVAHPMVSFPPKTYPIRWNEGFARDPLVQCTEAVPVGGELA